MLRRPPGRGYYDWPPPSLAEVRSRWLRWLCLGIATAGVLALVSFVLGHDDAHPGLSDRGWFTLAAAALLLVLLGVHHRLGALALLRALAEYAVVALLAVLLTITATGYGAGQPAANPPAAKPAGTAAKTGGDGCPPVKQVGAWLACLWRQANPPPPKPKQGPAMAPAPSTRRTP
jgi:hypothetical protein